MAGPLETLGYLFYVASPNRTSFETVEEVPDYTIQVVPYFFVLLMLEFGIRRYKRESTFRFNDAIGSVGQGMLQELARIFVRGVQLSAYCYVYRNWRLASLPWDSPWTWFLCFLGVDLAYYWLHRASHEINILWAAHQVHHSSEDYNLTTALRQSVFQNYSVWMFYLPLALAIPPSVFLVHTQFNLLYQFWIHNEIIKSLGPLEYVLNTASHHRVHHGRNRYCIDKNYAGTLIIWDRMFGTFEPEGEEVVYGLTHPVNTFEPFYIQMCHYLHIFRTAWSIGGFKNKLYTVVKGPGWTPGSPWHGNIEDVPDVSAPVQRYDPKLPRWCKAYVMSHFVLILFLHIETTERSKILQQEYLLPLLASLAFIVYSLSTFGVLLDGRSYAPWMEAVRCALFYTVYYYFLPVSRLSHLDSAYDGMFATSLCIAFAISGLFWSWHCLKSISVKIYSKKQE